MLQLSKVSNRMACSKRAIHNKTPPSISVEAIFCISRPPKGQPRTRVLASREAVNKSCKLAFLGHFFLRSFLFGRLIRSAEFLAEFIDATHRVNELLPTGVERMRGTGNINVVNGIFVAVFPFNRLGGADCRAGQDRKISRLILENDLAIFGVNFIFHGPVTYSIVCEFEGEILTSGKPVVNAMSPQARAP
jgi:hypothetical protein